MFSTKVIGMLQFLQFQVGISITLEMIEHVIGILTTVDYLRRPTTGEYVVIGQI